MAWHCTGFENIVSSFVVSIAPADVPVPDDGDEDDDDKWMSGVWPSAGTMMTKFAFALYFNSNFTKIWFHGSN